MELSVLVQRTVSDRFRAWCESPIMAEAEGATRDEALENLRAELGAKTRGVEVVRLSVPTDESDDPPGTCGDEQSNDPVAVAAWVAEFNAIPPLQMTAEEEAAWQSDRRARAVADARSIDRLAAELNEAGR